MDLIEEQGHGVAEHLAEQPAVQMPGVLDSDPLHLVTVHQLTKGRIDAVFDPAEESAALRPGVVGGTAERRLQLDRVLLQLFLEEGRPVVAVPHQQAGSFLGQCWDERRFMFSKLAHRVS